MLKQLTIMVAAILLAGCSGSDIGRVSGTVTMDGSPLPNANVEFFPQPTGRPSTGVTDKDGKYELTYTREAMGAKVGEHRVQITTAGMGPSEGGYGGNSKETVPARYNVKSELTAKVESGSNKHDFQLDGSGEIIQSTY